MPSQIEIIPQTIYKTIKAPASKSVIQRVIAGAILSENKTVISNPSFCDDCKAALKIAEDFGSEVIIDENKITIIPSNNAIKNKIHCGESGLGIRMFTPIISLFGKDIIISGEGSLKKRIVSGIADALIQGDVNCKTNKGYIPLNISGKLKGGYFQIDGSQSSQVLTGLLFALPKAEKDSIIRVSNLKSKPYINLTLKILKEFKIKITNNNYIEFHIKGRQTYISPGKYEIEGDWSAAAFLIVAGLIAGEICVTGLNLNSEQADKSIIQAVQSTGGNLSITNNSVKTTKSKLKAFNFDATHSPDLFPPLVSLASYCHGESVIKGVSRLIHKESNRAETLQKEFAKLGIEISLQDDYMHIKGGTVKGGIINSHNDHRIAMAAAVAALGAEKPVIIKNSDSINKSYPNFYKNLLD